MVQRQWIAIMLCLGLFVSILVVSVSANPLTETITKVYIQKDNLPVDTPVNYSMNCYGSYITTFPGQGSNEQKLSPQNPVYSYSLNCSSYGCPSYTFYNTWMVNITSCDIEGTYLGKSFIIRSFSKKPEPDCYWVDEPENKSSEYYTGIRIEDSSECWKDHERLSDQCDALIKSDKNEVIWRERYTECHKKINAEEEDCKKSRFRILNLTKDDILNNPWGKSTPTRYCQLWFKIPSESATPEMTTHPTGSLTVSYSPVATLYCNILSIFGSRC
jgi:hypothetical protein